MPGCLPLDSEVLRRLWKPLQRRCHRFKSDGGSSRKSCPSRSGPGCEEHGRHQRDICRAERAALRETARGPRQLQGNKCDWNCLPHFLKRLTPHVVFFVLQLLADCLTIVVAARMGKDFTGEVQAAFQKFLSVVVSSLGRQYH